MSSYRFKQRKMRWINLYPPYLGAGIRFKGFSDDGYACHVEMKLRWWNKNLFNTHFGGSIYAMCDPWFCFIVLDKLGPDYIVWDKSATVRFLKPGERNLKAVFRAKPEEIEHIRTQADSQGKTTYVFTAKILDSQGVLVAEVDKEVYARRKA